MSGFGFAGGEGTRRHCWAPRTSWTKGECSPWVMKSHLFLSRGLWFLLTSHHPEVSGQNPYLGYHRWVSDILGRCPHSLPLSAQEENLVFFWQVLGKLWPSEEMLGFLFLCSWCNCFQLLFEVNGFVRLKSKGAGGCRQVWEVSPTTAARITCR